MEWGQKCSTANRCYDGRDNDDIDRHVRRMLRFEKRHKIDATMSDEQICGVLSSGLLMWLFWQIAPELLMWIIAAVRKRIWGPS
jgi:hypothetical protein